MRDPFVLYVSLSSSPSSVVCSPCPKKVELQRPKWVWFVGGESLETYFSRNFEVEVRHFRGPFHRNTIPFRTQRLGGYALAILIPMSRSIVIPRSSPAFSEDGLPHPQSPVENSCDVQILKDPQTQGGAPLNAFVCLHVCVLLLFDTAVVSLILWTTFCCSLGAVSRTFDIFAARLTWQLLAQEQREKKGVP